MRIQYPVHQVADEEREYCYVADATGRELEIEEIVAALNASHGDMQLWRDWSEWAQRRFKEETGKDLQTQAAA